MQLERKLCGLYVFCCNRTVSQRVIQHACRLPGTVIEVTLRDLISSTYIGMRTTQGTQHTIGSFHGLGLEKCPWLQEDQSQSSLLCSLWPAHFSSMACLSFANLLVARFSLVSVSTFTNLLENWSLAALTCFL